MISLTPEQELEIIDDAKRELVKALITNHGKKVFLSKNEVAGILDWNPQTVMANLKPIDSTGSGGAVRFLLSDIEEHMEERKKKTQKGRTK